MRIRHPEPNGSRWATPPSLIQQRPGQSRFQEQLQIRKALAHAIKVLGDGDVLLVTRLDRLARSTRDLLNILDTISKAGAKFRTLADAWADTSTMHGELMVTILAGLATFERHLIRARTDEGRRRAQARGVRFGRPLKLSRYQIEEALARRAVGEPLTDIGRSYGVSHSTISRL